MGLAIRSDQHTAQIVNGIDTRYTTRIDAPTIGNIQVSNSPNMAINVTKTGSNMPNAAIAHVMYTLVNMGHHLAGDPPAIIHPTHGVYDMAAKKTNIM